MLEAYEAPSIVKLFQQTPRFGHPSDIGALFTGESSAKDYGLGLIFLPVIVLSIFFIWNVLLIVFKCFCSGNILGGAHLRKEEEGGGDNDGGVGRLRLKNCIYRGTIFLCAVSIVMLSTLSYMRLSGSLNDSFGSIRNTIDDLKDIVDNASATVDTIANAQIDFENTRITAIFTLGDGIFRNETVETPFDEDIDKIVDVLTEMGDWPSKSEVALTKVENALDTIERALSHDTFDIVIDTIEGNSAIAWITITMLIFSSFVLVGLCLAWFGYRSKCVSRTMGWILLPLFIASLCLSVFLLCTCGMIIVFNSDLCVGSASSDPEGLIKTIIDYEKLGDDPKDLLDHFIFDACIQSVDIIDQIDALVNETALFNDQLESSLEDLDALLADACSGSVDTIQVQSQLEYECANYRSSLDQTISSLQNFTETTDTLIQLTQNAVNCPVVNELYRYVSHDVICTQIPITIGWVFWIVLIYVLLGMIVYTLRGALFPSIIDDYDDHEGYDLTLNENGMAYVNNEGDVVIPFNTNDENGYEKSIRHKYYSQAGHEDQGLLMLELENTFSNSTDASSPKYFATI